MGWRQQELEEMHLAAKRRFHQNLWEFDKVSTGLGSVVAVPSVVVYHLERHAPGLHGPPARSS